MTPSFDIVTVGEALIVFVSRREPGADKLNLEGNPGGAPANVLSCAARLGKRTAIVTKVGSDGFGSFLQEQISRAGVCTDYMISDPLHPTTLAMVTLDATGNRSLAHKATLRRCLTRRVRPARRLWPIAANVELEVGLGASKDEKHGYEGRRHRDTDDDDNDREAHDVTLETPGVEVRAAAMPATHREAWACTSGA